MSSLVDLTRSPSRKGRKLNLKARAERQEQTRLRIVRAAVELHEELGPLATSITSIANRAGVERLTVYRHFPDEAALFAACTQFHFEAWPPPDLRGWRGIRDPRARLHPALEELYGYWRRIEGMAAAILGDYEKAPTRVGEGLVYFMAAAVAALGSGWGLSGGRRQRLNAALAVAVDFRTWRTLARADLDDVAAVNVIVPAIIAAAVRQTVAVGGPDLTTAGAALGPPEFARRRLTTGLRAD
jgi:AcrR family transcriptional regulator